MQLTTDRLRLRWLEDADAGFILQLVNDADWIRFIGDRRITDLEAARGYIRQGPLTMYREQGFGLNRVSLDDDTAIGICGLLKRASLDDVDLGFALMPEYRGKGYAAEAARAVIEHGRQNFDLARIMAIVHPRNAASKTLLAQLGFEYRETRQLEPNTEIVDLYSLSF